MGTLLPLIDLTSALPPQLVHNLTNASLPIKATVKAFLSLQAVVGNEFPRACQIKNTLDQVGNQQQQQQQQISKVTKSHGHGVIGSGKRTDGNAGGIMEFKVSCPEGQYTLRINEDELCALMLNSEYVLVKVYAEFGLRRNPFLIRWIELYQWLLDAYVDGDYGDDDGSRRNGDKKSDGELKLVKVRVAFIEAILNEVDDISNYSPKDYPNEATHYPVDPSKFDNDLIDQGLYDSKDEIPWNHDRYLNNSSVAPPPAQTKLHQQHENWGQGQQRQEVQIPQKQSTSQKDSWQASHSQTPPPGLTSRASQYSSQSQGQQRHQHAKSQTQIQPSANFNQTPYQSTEQRNEATLVGKLVNTLAQAQVDEISDSNSNLLIQHFADYPHHLFAAFDPSESSLNGLVQHNPKLTEGIVQIYLLSTPRESLERKELLQAMQRLPVTIGALDMLNHIVQAAAQAGGASNGSQLILTKQEMDGVLHGYLANAMLKAEALGANMASGNSAGLNASDGGYLSSGSNASNGPMASGVRSGNAPNLNGLTGYQARSFQHRMVQLLCLFVGSLMNTGIIRVEEYFYEVQELGVRYIFVKEARELWQRVKSGKV
ncbi:hypothetical protein DFH27DRAFT_25747 [Peziza echinospora]|nr:hypothetical protein DFH27DRAFT_25747 [Peziza echinospora]